MEHYVGITACVEVNRVNTTTSTRTINPYSTSSSSTTTGGAAVIDIVATNGNSTSTVYHVPKKCFVRECLWYGNCPDSSSGTGATRAAGAEGVERAGAAAGELTLVGGVPFAAPFVERSQIADRWLPNPAYADRPVNQQYVLEYSIFTHISLLRTARGESSIRCTTLVSARVRC